MSDDEVTVCHGGAKPGDDCYADVVAVDGEIIEWLRRKEGAMTGRWTDETDKKLCAFVVNKFDADRNRPAARL